MRARQSFPQVGHVCSEPRVEVLPARAFSSQDTHVKRVATRLSGFGNDMHDFRRTTTPFGIKQFVNCTFFTFSTK